MKHDGPWRGLTLGACLGVLATSSARAESLDPSSRDDSYADVWLQLDADRSAARAWVGGTKSWSSLDLGANLVLTQFYPGAWDPLQNDAVNQALKNQTRAPAVRAEVGPALLFGSLFIQPKLGLGYDFELETVGPLVPQVTAILEAFFLYFELSAQVYLYSPFESTLQDSLSTRFAALFTTNSRFGIGPQLEAIVGLHNVDGPALRSLPVGLTATVAALPGLSFGAFAGGDPAHAARYHFPVGRLTGTYLF